MLFFILWIIIVLKAVFFWVYLWQIKEYRFDRFRAEYGKMKTILKFWLGSGGRRLAFPRFTIKAILIILLSLLVIFYGGLSLSFFSTGNYYLLAFLLFASYLLAMPIIAVIVFLFKIPTLLIKIPIFYLSKRKMEKFKNIIVIGITGSYGKSSTKEFLFQILKNKFKVKKTSGNINTAIGIAKTVLFGIDGNEDIFIVEMGAYKVGEIKKICGMVKPKIGILTGIGVQHLALFGSFENIKKAKYELIEALPEKDGLALFNGENKYCLELSWDGLWNGKKMIYKKLRDPNLLRFVLKWPEYYLENIQAAVEVAKYFKMADEEIEKAFCKIKIEDRGIKNFIGREDALIINDTYNANPEGVFANLSYLKSQPYLVKILVMPCLIELGELSDEIHCEIGKAIAKTVDLAIIAGGEDFASIQKGAGDKAVFEANPQKIKELLLSHLAKKTAVLLEGRVPKEVVKFLI